MADNGYKSLISYKLAQIAFDLGWDFVPKYYNKYEDSTTARPNKTSATLSTSKILSRDLLKEVFLPKLKLYDVAKASGMEALEDFEDILRFERLAKME